MRRIACDDCPARAQGNLCDLPLATLNDIRKAGITTAYRPRQVLFGEGNPADGLYLICQGRVKLYQSDRFGRERVLEIADQGAVVGELALQEDRTLATSAEATEDAQICFVSRERLIPLIREYPDLSVRLIEALSRGLSVARRKFRDLAFKDAGTRLALLLLELAQDSDADQREVVVHVPYTRAQMAQRVGVSTETAIRLLRKLADRGLLEIHGRDVRITNIERLARVAHSDELGDMT